MISGTWKLSFVLRKTLVLTSPIHEFHVTSSPYQQRVGDKINLKTETSWESNYLPGTDRGTDNRAYPVTKFL